MLKIGVLGLPGKWSSEILAEELEKMTGERHLFSVHQLRLDISERRVFCGKVDLTEFHALVVKKLGNQYSPEMNQRLSILKLLEDQGVRIFSSTHALGQLIDRLSCTVTLAKLNIPMPATLITESAEEAYEELKKFSKAVFKPLYTSKARGMEVMEAKNTNLSDILAYQQNNPILYLQKFVDSAKQDLGISFLGGQYLGTYARRKNNSSWTTSTFYGGSYQAFDPPQEYIDLAQRAISPFDLDFTCVDLVETAEGPMIYEVSAFGGFKGLKDANHINAARLYARHVIQQLNQN